MADEPDAAVLTSVLATEHFALQSVSGATVSESGSRAAIYLSALSSGLVAIGFASGSGRALLALAATVLPTVFVLGCFTTVRLVDTSVENIVALRRIEAIRGYYRGLHPAAERYVPDARRVAYGRWSALSTLASMTGVVNSVLGGATVALIGHGTIVSIVAGGLAGALVLAAMLTYQHRRLGPYLRS